MIRLFHLPLLITAAFFNAQALASSTPVPELGSMKPVGQAKLRVAFWDIYSASLLTTDGKFTQDKPFALKLKYLRDFKKKNLIKETRKQLLRLNDTPHSNTETWLLELDALWVNVKKNDAITLYVDEQGHAHFLHNDNYLGRISDPAFSNDFSAIWLSDKSAYPKMQRQLIGQSDG